MPSSYPGALDAFTNPSAAGGDTLDDPPHDDQHADANDAIEAIETELGINPRGSEATVRARLDAIESAASDLPQGEVADANVTSIDTGSPPYTHTGLSVSHAAEAGRVYEATWVVPASLYNGGASGRQRISHQISRDGASVGTMRSEGQTAGTAGPGCVVKARQECSADATWNWTFTSLDVDGVGFTTVGLFAASTAPSLVSVKDVGPV